MDTRDAIDARTQREAYVARLAAERGRQMCDRPLCGGSTCVGSAGGERVVSWFARFGAHEGVELGGEG